MSKLKGKKILLAVCGSIAAYKSAILVRLLVKEEAIVKIIMTKEAGKFISPLSLSTLSKNPVHSELTLDHDSLWNNHVELGLWADAMLVAPASANTIAKFANGICDNLLSAVYLSARCPVIISPAMDEDMWKHGSTKKNIEALKQNGNIVLNVAHGELASGLIGEGRMMEPENILDYLSKHFIQSDSLSGKRILITAGGTHEAIDPVRFIGNHSSGKMGFALAEQAAKHGALVTLIHSNTSAPVPSNIKKLISVQSADDMYSAVMRNSKSADVIIMAAAVADFKVKKISAQKIKKSENSLTLELEKTKDILAELGKRKTKNQFLVGFALETNDEETNALQKLKAKNLDLIVMNSMNEKGAGFGFDTNKVTIIQRGGKKILLPLKLKSEIAHEILEIIIEKIHA
ncbi:MAG TPA: bifunctional phosphopantothenoylcysteine decarboxylase/phosphopantothenate--cysteine ligase CoaBC [Bacteroidetes bacterium]|nr:bifunctional phosphopantothenoylcysteine decarboxylase/phosphopantothenate--cysteine ligase CoaBC [Bacteroidota bacterium]